MLSVDFSLNKQCQLGIKDFFSELGQEFFEKTPCVKSHFLHSVNVDEDDFETEGRVKVPVTAKHSKGVLKDEVATNPEQDVTAVHLKACLHLLKQFREDFGAHSEVIDPRDTLKGRLVDNGAQLLIAKVLRLRRHVFVNNPKVTWQ